MASHNERCKDCKRRVTELLRAVYGEVIEQHDLNLPSRFEDYRPFPIFEALAIIHGELQRHRGFSNFVRARKLPKVDYFIPSRRLVVEFDESQHFTVPRMISLKAYPENLALGYSRNKWMELAQKLNKKDNDPPFRDEQRAWYDTLRDFSSTLLNYSPTVRVFANDTLWCALNAKDKNDIARFSNQLDKVEHTQSAYQKHNSDFFLPNNHTTRKLRSKKCLGYI